MKKNLLAAFALVSAFALNSCSKEGNNGTPQENGDVYSSITVKEENTALVAKHSGTLCGPCGSWGWDAWKAIISANEGKAGFVTAFDSNFVAKLFITQTAETWAKNSKLTGWPTFVADFVVQTKMNGQYIDVNGTVENVNYTVDSHHNGPVLANAGFKISVDGDIMTLNIKTKFFAGAEGDYYQAVYVVENDVMGAQYGRPNYPTPVAHEYVMRDVFSPEGNLFAAFGDVLVNGTVEEGTEFKNEVKFKLESDWNRDNIEVYVVLWRKNGSKYEFVNLAKQ